MAIVVDEPIINSPFAEPTRHYRSRNGDADLRAERRPSGYTPGLRTRGGQTSVLEDDYVELPIVNEIRRLVARWREAGFPGATRTTLDLLRHWSRPERERRLFSASSRRPRRRSGWWRDRSRTGRSHRRWSSRRRISATA